MARTSKARAGFTLTEILMAVGILGVGLTMVASVFPVAVDQSRRSRDLTMAALSARSVVAVMRARRDEVINWCRQNAKTEDTELPTTAMLTSAPLPQELRCYNPYSFLYDRYPREGQSIDPGQTEIKDYRQYNPKALNAGLWSVGGYVPLVFATPMSSTGYGPWRITIVVYKARGSKPDIPSLDTWPPAFNFKAWKDNNRADVGGYIMDWDGHPENPNTRGQAYKVERFHPGVIAAGDTVVPAGASYYVGSAQKPQFHAKVADRDIPCIGAQGVVSWVSLPGAIAAYHTILGD